MQKLTFGVSVLVVGLVCAQAIADKPDNGFNRPQQDLAGWERSKRDLLSGFSNMYQPCVVPVADKDYPFRMWFFGWAVGTGNKGYPGVDAIFHARSKDLQKWEVYAGSKDKQDQWDDAMDPKKWVPVVTAGKNSFDDVHAGDPSVVLKDGTYYMAYTAAGSLGKRKYPSLQKMISCVMGASSKDGIRWTKTDRPLAIEPNNSQEAATEAEYSGYFARPCLLWDQGKWRLWFDHLSPGNGLSMGYAENTGAFDAADGFKVLQAGKNPLLRNWLNPDVIKVGKRYHCFADAVDLTRKYDPKKYPIRNLAICEAVSDDGIDWKVVGYMPPEDDVPSAHIPQASILEVDGKKWLYVFYACQRGGEPKYDYRYDRIRAMRRPLD